MVSHLNKTAHKVLDVAEELIQKRGFNAFSFKDLQERVGIKTSSIHYYFPTKQELASALIERYSESFKDQLSNCLLYTSPSPRDQRGSRMPSSA